MVLGTRGNLNFADSLPKEIARGIVLSSFELEASQIIFHECGIYADRPVRLPKELERLGVISLRLIIAIPRMLKTADRAQQGGSYRRLVFKSPWRKLLKLFAD